MGVTGAKLAIKRALISAFDKSGLAAFAAALARHGVELVSTGGSARTLAEAGLNVVEVAELTGFPEIMDGRVKTLHPKVHGGILARRDKPAHRDAMAAHGIPAIDLVVVNLYPFAAAVASGADDAACVENIDIGGPAMIRAAAKNHAHVAVVTDPADYDLIAGELATHGGVLAATARRLAAAAFAHTAHYDAVIAAWMHGRIGDADMPRRFTLAGERSATLRYGENPHQQAALYLGGAPRRGVATAAQIQGKALSYNNLLDADAAFELAAEFAEPAAVIVKHGNPCGAAVADDAAAAFVKALAGDPVSAFGGVVAFNQPLEAAAAAAMSGLFLELVIAPRVTAEARAVLAAKANLRVLETGAMPDAADAAALVRTLAGGFVLQSRDVGRIDARDLKTVSRRAPTAAEIGDLMFAWTLVKHVKSNAIALVRDGALVGVGAGQMSRVDSCRIAVEKATAMAAAAGEAHSRANGAVVASDAFFPFADGLDICAEAGVAAAIQPGGSKRDAEVIAAADGRDMAMVFTAMRHFRH